MKPEKQVAPYVIRLQAQLNTFIAIDFPPGPKFVPWYVIINLQKGCTLPFCLALMWRYDNFSPSACFYTAAHGGYGLVWLLKHCVARDTKWDTQTTLLGQAFSFVCVLGPYWIAPFLLISRTAPEPSLVRCLFAMVAVIVGIALMIIADSYKHVALKLRPNQLIEDGPFRSVRHPNYTGEMLLYSSFAAMVPHVLPKVVLAIVWLQVFLPNMLLKEQSMSRHEGWAKYKARTGMLLPPLWLHSKML